MTTSDELVKQLLGWAPYVWTALTGLVGVLVWLVPRLIAEGRKRAAEEAERDLAASERARLRVDLLAHQAAVQQAHDEHEATMHDALLQQARLLERMAAAERDLRRHSDRARKHSSQLLERIEVPPHRLPRTTRRDTEPDG